MTLKAELSERLDGDPSLLLSEAQDKYVWDWSWPPGCATLSKLPDDERYPAGVVQQVIKLNIDLARNHAKVAIAGVKNSGHPPIPSSAADVQKSLFSVAEAFQAGAPKTRPDTIDGYIDYFATIPRTPLVDRQTEHPELADTIFAWQRIAGANPMSLQQIQRLPDDFPLTEAQWQGAISSSSLAAALDAGQVYAVDFTALHGAPCTRYLGRQKYLCGTRGIFAAVTRTLQPVAIQLDPGGPVVTPRDGVTWAMAKYCLQVADANVHETMEHLGKTHMVMEAVGIAAHRQLVVDHPLFQLVKPHIEGTFAINNAAKTSLIAPGGVIDKVFSARIDVAASLVRKALDGFVLQDRAPAKELAARGLSDPAALEFPYREDVLPVYAATERFVRAYVALYYSQDADVVADTQLQAWVAEVGSSIGGALKNIRPVQSVEGLVEWMTNIVHLGSSQHAAVNFPQFPFFGWGANVAGAMWAPPPSGAVTDADLLELMPPWDCLFLQADEVYELANVYYSKLGFYRFSDEKTAPVVEQFQADLAEIEKTNIAADQNRLITYPFLRPSLIPASINI
jgi:arachidonate 15-lipoxygenase